MIKKIIIALLFIFSIHSIYAQQALGDSLFVESHTVETNDTTFLGLFGEEQIKDSTMHQRIANLYMDGLKSMKKGDRDSNIKAIECFSKCIELDSTHSASYYQLGTMLLSIEEYGKGINAMKLAYKYSPNNPFYKYSVAQLLTRSPSTINDALPLLKELHSDHPENLDYMYALMNTYNRLNRKKDCLKVLDDLEEQEGYSQQVGLIRLQVINGQPRRKVIKEWERLINHYPLDPSFKLELSQYYFQIGKDKQGQEWLENALAIHPNDGNVLLAYAKRLELNSAQDSLIESYVLKAMQDLTLDPSIRIQHYRKYIVNHSEKKSFVIESFKAMQKRYPEDVEIASFYIEYLEKKKDTLLLIPALEKLITMDDSQSHYFDLMDLYQTQSDTIKLTQLIDQARNKFDDPTWDLVFVQYNMQDSTRFPIALQTIDSLLNNNPIKSTQIFCYRIRANYYQFMKDYARAKTDYDALILLNPKDYMAMNNYAYMLTSMPNEDLKYAYSLSQQSVNAEPSNPSYLDTYAWISFLLKDYKTAYFYIQRALSYAPNEETIKTHYTLIKAYLDSTTKEE